MLDNETVLGIVSSSLAGIYPKSAFAIDQNAIKSFGAVQVHSLLTKVCVTMPRDEERSHDLLIAPLTKLLSPEHMLDGRYHFDFTNIVDKTTFYRGGKPYFRPVGYQRYAFKVEGKYNDDVWLTGINRRRNQESSADGEWPVSYHGTSYKNGLSIGEEGFRLSRCVRNLYGDGIYSTPNVNVASQFARKAIYKGKRYEIIIQNRVNPKNLQVVGKNVNDVGEYWISPSENDIRPYGLCIREC